MRWEWLQYRRNRTEQRDRANILLAGALMLAVLIVVGAVALTLAPTGSDGTTGQSPSSSDVDTLEAGLEPIFIESHDIFLDEVPPVHVTQERPPIDPETVASLLESERFTERQVNETVEWLLALANQDTPAGSIASLEPTDETQTGTLLRLGNEETHEFAGEERTLYESAGTVQDLVVVLETATLPHEAQEPFELRIGDWKMEAYQENETSDTIYRVDGLAGGGALTTAEEQLRLDFSENTINGVPVPGNQSLAVDPGQNVFDVTVTDSPSPGDVSGTRGGVSIVASGGNPTVPDEHTVDVVTQAAFEATYLDDATTFTSHITIPARYTAIAVEPCDCERAEFTELSLTVETENPENLAGIDADNVWFPAYHAQPSEYELVVEEVALNGTAVDNRTNDAEFTFNSSDCERCVDLDQSPDGVSPEQESAVVATPSNLTEELVIEATVGNRTATTNVTVHDPYQEATLEFADTLSVGEEVGEGSFSLIPQNTTQAPYTPELDELSDITIHTSYEFVEVLTEELNIQSGDAELIGEAIAQLDDVDEGNFLSLEPDEQANLLGYDGDEQDTVADFFGDVETGELTVGIDSVLDQSDGVDAVVALFSDTGEVQADALSDLHRATNAIEGRGAGIQPHYLYELGTEDDGITDTDSFELVTMMASFSSEETGTAKILFEYIEWFASDPEDLYALDDEILDAAVDVGDDIDFEDYSVTALEFLGNVENVIERLGTFPEASDPAWDYPDTPFTELNNTEQQEYLWLAGIEAVDDRDAVQDAVDALESGAEVGWDEMFGLAGYNVIDTTALIENGVVELDYPQSLAEDVDITVTGTYDDYGFANYTASDNATVIDPTTDIERIETEIVPQGAAQDLFSHDDFDDISLPHDPILVDHPAEVLTTVTYIDDMTEVNPEYVSHELVGPTAEDVGVDPDSYATLNTTTTPPTLTAKNRTGVPANYGVVTGTITRESLSGPTTPPLTDVTVSVSGETDDGEAFDASTQTDENGEYELKAPPGEYWIETDPDGYDRSATLNFQIEIGERHVWSRTLSPSSTSSTPGETGSSQDGVGTEDREHTGETNTNRTTNSPDTVATTDTDEFYAVEPIKVEATVGTLSDTAKVEAIEVETEASVSFDEDFYVPRTSRTWPEYLFPRGLTSVPVMLYQIEWGVTSQGDVMVPVDVPEGYSDVDPTHGSYDETFRHITLPGETDGSENITFTDIDEEKALGLGVGEQYSNATGTYRINEISDDDNGGGGGGGGGGDGQILALALGSTNYQAPSGAFGDYPTESLSISGGIEVTVEEGDTVGAHLEHNLRAQSALNANPTALEDGDPSWRASPQECKDNTEDGVRCTNGFAFIDFTTSANQFSAGPNDMVASIGGGGVWVTDDDGEGGTVTATYRDSGLSASVGISVTVEDDGGDPDPENCC